MSRKLEVSPEVSGSFQIAAEAAGYSEEEVVEMCNRFKNKEQEEFLDSLALGKIDNEMARSIFRVIFEQDTLPSGIRADVQMIGALLGLGAKLYEFYNVHDTEDMTVADLKDISLVVKLLEEFFHQGRFVDLADKSNLLAGAAAFTTNRAIKVAETIEPGQKVAPFDFDQPRTLELFDQVDEFSQQFLTLKGLGKDLKVGGKNKNWRAKNKKKEVILDEIRNLSTKALENMKQLERHWQRGVEGLYLLKNCLIVSSALSDKDVTLQNLVSVCNLDEMLTRYSEASGKIVEPEHYKACYSFGRHKEGIYSAPGFGVHDLRVTKRRPGGNSVVHYNPDTLMYAGLIVEHFKSLRQQIDE